jgi:sulfatase maturation enzyme AslB (radical SAM superfamily)
MRIGVLKKTDILPAWGRILTGRRPMLSLEITKECPLHCPGCYAYEPGHLGDRTLHQLTDYRGTDLVTGVLALVRRYRPIHISIVGGEPLVRYRELDTLLPKLGEMNVEVQLVTSAVRPIPQHWAEWPYLHVAVSVDGLPEDHDIRRAPATYERIWKNIEGHSVIIHCTVTRQMLRRPGYLADFARLWSGRREARKIWFSLYTPQTGDCSAERLRPEDRSRALTELADVAAHFSKVALPAAVLEGYRQPPVSPQECIFAQTTTCISADLSTNIAPCQFGGEPVCADCGCMASAGLVSIGRYKLLGVLPISKLLTISQKVGGVFGARPSRPAEPQSIPTTPRLSPDSSSGSSD